MSWKEMSFQVWFKAKAPITNWALYKLTLLCPVTSALQFQFKKRRMKECINLAEIHITGLWAKQKWSQAVLLVKYSWSGGEKYGRNGFPNSYTAAEEALRGVQIYSL